MIDRAQRSDQLLFKVALDDSLGNAEVDFALVNVDEVPCPDDDCLWIQGEWLERIRPGCDGWARTADLEQMAHRFTAGETAAVWVRLRPDVGVNLQKPCALVRLTD